MATGPERTDSPDAQARRRALVELMLEERRRGRVAPPIRRRGSVGSPPLSFAQQRLWFLDQLEPGDPAYNVAAAWRLCGDLDAASLERSLEELVRRHEILRTTFEAPEGQPVQRVGPVSSSVLRRIDLHGIPATEREDEARRHLAAEMARLFDLARGPLFRALLVTFDQRDHVLVLAMHHIVSDGWSFGVLFRELDAAYSAWLRGAAPALPPLPIQYADYAAWQRERMQGEALERELGYWKEKLRGAAPLELATDRPRPPLRTHRGAVESRSLPVTLGEALARLCDEMGVTLFMTVLAAFQALLSRYAGQPDVSVGSPIAGRNRQELEGLIGFFVNMLVLRTDLSGDPTFRELLGRVKKVCLDAYTHQEVPFERLVDELESTRDTSRTPLFQVGMAVQDAAMATVRLGEVTATPVEVSEETAKFDLTLIVTETKAGLDAAIEYSTDLFERATIARWLANFEVLLEGIVADPDRPLSALPMLTDAERGQVVERWNGPEVDYPQERCVHELVVAQAAIAPEALAVVCGGEALSYGELNGRAERLAHYLGRQGVGPGAVVGICVEPSVEMVVGLLGILKAGGAYLPLDPTYPEDRLAFMAADASVRLILTQARLTGRLALVLAPIVRLDADLDEMAAETPGASAVTAKPHDLAYVIYTSGSTGRPKGVLIEHRGLTNLVFAKQQFFGTTAADRTTQVAAFGFDATVFEIWPTLAVGATLCVADEDTRHAPERMLAWLKDQAVTQAFLPTPMAEVLLDEDWRGARLRILATAGDVLRRRPGADAPFRLFNLYGPTETTVWATGGEVAPEPSEGLPSIGRPITNVRVYVLDEGLKPVPVGVSGELVIGGVGVGRGYLGRPDLTRERFVPSPFVEGDRLYRTGDRARWRADGVLEFLGRLDTQVKIRGVRIELGEIEAVLTRQAGVREAAVVAREDRPGEKRLVAYIVPRDATAPAVAELRASLRATLPEYMVPAAYVALPALPLTANGKVDRGALPVPEPAADAAAYEAPRTPAEELLAGVWAGVLGRGRVSRHDNFFDIGGHSLLATQVMSRVRAVFGVELPLRRLFEMPTVAELALELPTGARSARAPIAPVTRDASLPLSFAQQRLWFLDQLFPGRSTYNVPGALRLTGTLDVGALTRSLEEIVRRHEALRARFESAEGGPTQVIAPSGDFTLRVVDLTGVPEPAREAEARREAAAEAVRPFELAHGPLLRVTLLHLGPRDHILVLVMHHIVTDGWSVGVLTRELTALYASFLRGEPSPLPPLPIQYVDFAAWQREALTQEVLGRQLEYWRAQLAGAAGLELPTDRPRPMEPTQQGAQASRVLPAGLGEALRALGRREGATFFMTLLAGFQALLHRYTGQSDISVGSPVAGRTRAEVEGLIGFFVNTLALRTDLEGDPSFRELLKRVREVCLGAYAHQDVPFEKLVEELTPARDTSRTPLFQVMLVVQDGSRTDIRLPGLEVGPFEIPGRTAKFDLTLFVGELGPDLVATVEYSTDLFNAQTIERLLGHWGTLLAGIVANPESRLSALPLLTQPERTQILVEWNRTAEEYPRDRCLHELVAAQAARTPEAPAVVCEGKALTYGELERRANQVAQALRKRGVGPEVLVGIAMERSVELVVGVLGILKAGGAYVPIDPEYPTERVAYMLEDAAVPVLLSQAALVERLPMHKAAVLCLDHDADWLAEEPATAPVGTVGPDHLAYVIYTSGSTGRPKGAMNTHRGICNRLQWMQATYGLTGADRVLHKTPISFDVSVWELFWPLMTGATLVMARPQGHRDPAYLVEAVQAERITVAHFVPSMLQIFLAEPGVKGCRTLRQVICSGEALPYELVQRFYARLPARLDNLYGPTEAAVDVTWWRCEPEDPRGLVPIGQPVANTQIYIVDGHGQPVPVGVAGELCIGGVQVGRGYWRRPELTAERFVPDPFSGVPGARLYRTGDRARYLPDGAIEYLGRLDFQVKIRGFRIELGEIEAVLGQHPGVREVVVVAREDPPGDKRLVAYLVVDGSASPSASDLRAHVRERLPEYMVPAAFVTLETLPLTSNGKVDRRALPVPESACPPEAEYVAPETSAEELLAGIWAEVLGVPRVGRHDNFFDIGGHSLLMARVQTRLRTVLGWDVRMIDLFRYPTVSALAAHRNGGAPDGRLESSAPARRRGAARGRPGEGGTGAIAVIGMAGRFPGARNLQELWRNLRAGVESVTFFTDAELEAAGVAPTTRADSRYVRAGAILDGIEQFDAAFFGVSPRDAEILDPQQRLFLECAWEALEDAGCDPSRSQGAIGVFGGASLSTYLMNNLQSNRALIESAAGLQIHIGNDKDFVPTLVSYKLDLKGPAVSVQTACSTSLVAVHLACRSLLEGASDIALAGGVSIHSPQKVGYLYQEGGIVSPDGHCRAFDAEAAGTVGGEGVALVVLKRLEDAQADGDTIRAVILGSAINNDGAAKVGFTAPSVQGQAAVIRAALATAGVESDGISYVETHGTGTRLGDPIEIAALTEAFGRSPSARGTCAIGSLKSNMGHLDAAAGVAGLIKTVLALENRELPPSLHYQRPNPEIDLAASPFYVNTTLAPWTAERGPRRAGVSSFGIGGTNAHVILEEAPEPGPAGPSRPVQLLLLSARTPTALETATDELQGFLTLHRDVSLPDVAHTLHLGRKPFPHRRMLLCRDVGDAVAALGVRDPERVLSGVAEPGQRSVVFMFPGQGAQHVEMARGLYEIEPVFRAEVDRCADLLEPDLGADLRAVLYPGSGGAEAAAKQLRQTAFAQPALFVVEYALARLWMAWGVKPEAMVGHSVGEYVAACLAGVLQVEDALRLVATRGRLMEAMPPGAMLVVPRPEAEVRELLGPDLALAAVNGPSLCVVAGTEAAVAELEARLGAQGVPGRRLHTSHAFHSAMMDPILGPFARDVARTPLAPPTVPYVSSMTGTWITTAEATDPRYWARQLRETVRFREAVDLLLAEPNRVFLEVGPGGALTSLVRQHPQALGRATVSSLRRPHDTQPDLVTLMTALGRLWLAGVQPDWAGFYAGERRRRLPLPTYPFERQRYWIEPDRGDTLGPEPSLASEKAPDVGDWFYVPSWRRAAPSTVQAAATSRRTEPWLVFEDDGGLAATLTRGLQGNGGDVVSVVQGEGYSRLAGDRYAIDPSRVDHYEAVLGDLVAAGRVPSRIVHAWGVGPGGSERAAAETVDRTLTLGFHSLLHVVQAWERQRPGATLEVWVLADGLHEVTGDEVLAPRKATVVGACRVIPQEHPNIMCRVIDVDPTWLVAPDAAIRDLVAEVTSHRGAAVVAYRHGHRWTQAWEAVRLERGSEAPIPALRMRGVYLITGGLGEIGLELAAEFARAVQARLALVGRSAFPPREHWDEWVASHGPEERTSRTIARLRNLEAAGAEVLIARADVADREQMSRVLAEIDARFGAVQGVVHAAGVADERAFAPVLETTEEHCAQHFRPKIQGVLALEELFAGRNLDFCVLVSSLSSVLGGLGFAAYAAANAFMDAFAQARRMQTGHRWASVALDGWRPVTAPVPRAGTVAALAMTPGEGVEVFRRVLAHDLPGSLIVSTADLAARSARWIEGSRGRPADPVRPSLSTAAHARPDVPTAYVAPRDAVEERIATIWQELLGIATVGIHDDFFDLGGHSLLATQVVARLREAFELDVPLRSLFEATTVAHLAEVVSRRRRTRDEELGTVARMLDVVEGLSDEQIRELLERPDEAGRSS